MEMSLESIMAVGTGMVSRENVEEQDNTIVNYDGYADGTEADLARTEEALHFADTYFKLQDMHSSEKLRMIKKINTAYNGKTIGNTNVANSVESFCNNAMSTEGVGDKIKTILEKIKQFFQMLMKNIVSFFKFLVAKIKSLFVKKEDIVDTANNLQTIIKNTNVDSNNSEVTISEEATCEFMKTEAKTAKTKNKKIKSSSKLGKIIKKTVSKKQTNTSNSKISEDTNDVSNNVSSMETESIITNTEIDKFVAIPNEEIKKEAPELIETVEESISKLLNDKSVKDYYYYLGVRTILTGNSLSMRKTTSDTLFEQIEQCYNALFVKNDLTLAKKYIEPLEDKYREYQRAEMKYTSNNNYQLPGKAKSDYWQIEDIKEMLNKTSYILSQKFIKDYDDESKKLDAFIKSKSLFNTNSKEYDELKRDEKSEEKFKMLNNINKLLGVYYNNLVREKMSATKFIDFIKNCSLY